MRYEDENKTSLLYQIFRMTSNLIYEKKQFSLCTTILKTIYMILESGST